MGAFRPSGHFPISHFNEKVRWALDWKGIAHARKALGLDDLPRALLATGRPTLPILFLDEPDPPLYPSDPAERHRAIALEDWFDENLGHQMRAGRPR